MTHSYVTSAYVYANIRSSILKSHIKFQLSVTNVTDTWWDFISNTLWLQPQLIDEWVKFESVILLIIQSNYSWILFIQKSERAALAAHKAAEDDDTIKS